MPDSRPADASLLDRLPLPLAQLYRRAHNAKTPRDAHDCAAYLWEAALKLLASGAIATSWADDENNPDIAEKLKPLARPSLGHWREIVRMLIPKLSNRGSYAAIIEALDDRRADLPRCAALDSSIRGANPQQTVCIADLLDRIVEHRNKSAHGAFATKSESFFRPLAHALLAAAAELFPKLDVLAGRRLIAVTEIRPVRTTWLVERSELHGVAPWRIASLELPRTESAAPALVEGLYLVDPNRPDDSSTFIRLRPLLDFDSERETVRFLNGRRGKNFEMLCYATGERYLVPLAPGDSPAGLELPEIDDSPPADSPGAKSKMIGDYEVVSELGRGAMGVVYRAKQIALGRDVALKVQPKPNDPKADARFRREIRALARVDHPNLVKVFTSGVDGEKFYYTMELLDGAPLTAISDALTSVGSNTAIDLPQWQSALSAACDDVKRREKSLSGEKAPSPPSPLPQSRERGENLLLPSPGFAGEGMGVRVTRDYIRQIVTLIRQTAEAAHALHEAGVLHRDIKPGNIQVSPDGSQAVLLDLGLAQLADDVEGRLTRTTQFVGTRRYAGPEQQIDARSIDRRADVYSLGATLWELIALRPLFNATDATPLPELIARVQRDEPTRLCSICPAVSRDLEAVVHKCLEKRPEHRYATAGELAKDLQRVLDGEPVTARAVSGVDRAIKWVKRRPVLAGLYAAVVALIAVTVGSVIVQQQKQIAAQQEREATERTTRAEATVKHLQTADIASVPEIIRTLQPLSVEAEEFTRNGYAVSQPGTPERMRYLMAMLRYDTAYAEELLQFVPRARANEILALRQVLAGYTGPVGSLWTRMEQLESPFRGPANPEDPLHHEELPVSAMLCSFFPEDERWPRYAGKLAAMLSALNPLEAAGWEIALDPLKSILTPELVEIYRRAQSELRKSDISRIDKIVAAASQLDLAANLLTRYAADDPRAIAELLQIADARHFKGFLRMIVPQPGTRRPGSQSTFFILQSTVRSTLLTTMSQKPPAGATDEDIERLALRQANAATALIHFREPAPAWRMLVHTPDPTARSYLIHGMGPREIDPRMLIQRYQAETDISVRRALVLALGEFPNLSDSQQEILPQLLKDFRDHPDPGLHGAIDWLLRQKWGKAAELDKIVAELRSPQRQQRNGARGWFVNEQGQTYSIIRGPIEFTMGSPPNEPDRYENEEQRRVTIRRTLAVATRPVTKREFRTFLSEVFIAHIGNETRQSSPDDNGPMTLVYWHEAAQYCRWLSERDGIPEDEMPYPSIPEIRPGMSLPTNYLERRGYRLPTEAEWEFACRSGSDTARPFGRGTDLLGHYAWYFNNSRRRAWPCGQLKPNDLGLFDMIGNVFEWCNEVVNTEMVIRGGSWASHPPACRSAYRMWSPLRTRSNTEGFRPVLVLSGQ